MKTREKNLNYSELFITTLEYFYGSIYHEYYNIIPIQVQNRVQLSKKKLLSKKKHFYFDVIF